MVELDDDAGAAGEQVDRAFAAARQFAAKGFGLAGVAVDDTGRGSSLCLWLL